MHEVDPIQSEPEPVDGDPVPCPEDEEYFVRPDAGDMEEAIDKFLDGLDGQERSGFEEIHRFLATLPIPSAKESRSMTHAEAIQGQFLPDMDEEQRKRFTPSAGCLRSWLSGLGRTCRRSWVFQTKLIRELSPALAGLLLS